MSIHLLTFGGDYHGDNYISAAENLRNWAQEFNVFESITVINREFLLQDSEFSSKHMNFILQNKRGFGYWVWKPYIIYKKLQQLKEGDILLYLDACCFLNVKGKDKFLEMIELVKQNPDGNLFFEYDQIISDWCKMDLIDALDAKEVMYKREVMPAVEFITVNIKMITFYKVFYEIACNYHLIDDTPSVAPNSLSFHEHRHDQSIFSILVRKYLPRSISTELYQTNFYYYKKEEQGREFPIWIHANNHYGYKPPKIL
jgi:hypothetical protein